MKDSKDYFLADRWLTRWVIGLSIIGANVGTNSYIGASGNAYSIGIAQANFEDSHRVAHLAGDFSIRDGGWLLHHIWGLAAVAITDSLQVCIMFLCSLIIMYLGLEGAGGWDNFASQLTEEHPTRLQTYLPRRR